MFTHIVPKSVGSAMGLGINGPGREMRAPTKFPSTDFESVMSAYSIIPGYMKSFYLCQLNNNS